MGRLGALIELISLPVFAWLYGAATLGIFFTLWAAVRILTALCEYAIPTALQRFIPQARNASEANSLLYFGIKLSLGFSLTLSVIISLAAPLIAPYLNASAQDAPHLVNIIQIYVWILPAWVLVEVFTSSVRAQRKFGPEIRIRIFYEQLARLIFAVLCFFAGLETYGLFVAHIVSVVLALLLSFRLMTKFYTLADHSSQPEARMLLSFSTQMMPANMIKKANSELPTLLLNILVPGVSGAEAAGYFGVARKLASVLQVVRQSFEYVIAPFANLKDHSSDLNNLRRMYRFSTKMIATLIIPLSFMLIFIRQDILLLFKPEYLAAEAAIVVLALGRLLEGMTGPSAALIEMRGHFALPLLNGALGLLALIYFQYSLVPDYGLIGAAFAAAISLNVTAFLSLIECMVVLKLSPYDRFVFRPVFISAMIGIGGAMMLSYFQYLGSLATLIYALCFVFISIALVARFGLLDEDRGALGKFGQFFAPKIK